MAEDEIDVDEFDDRLYEQEIIVLSGKAHL